MKDIILVIVYTLVSFKFIDYMEEEYDRKALHVTSMYSIFVMLTCAMVWDVWDVKIFNSL